MSSATSDQPTAPVQSTSGSIGPTETAVLLDNSQADAGPPGTIFHDPDWTGFTFADVRGCLAIERTTPDATTTKVSVSQFAFPREVEVGMKLDELEEESQAVQQWQSALSDQISQWHRNSMDLGDVQVKDVLTKWRETAEKMLQDSRPETTRQLGSKFMWGPEALILKEFDALDPGQKKLSPGVKTWTWYIHHDPFTDEAYPRGANEPDFDAEEKDANQDSEDKSPSSAEASDGLDDPDPFADIHRIAAEESSASAPDTAPAADEWQAKSGTHFPISER